MTVIREDVAPVHIDIVAELNVNAGGDPTVIVTGVLALSHVFTPDSETYKVVVAAIEEPYVVAVLDCKASPPVAFAYQLNVPVPSTPAAEATEAKGICVPH